MIFIKVLLISVLAIAAISFLFLLWRTGVIQRKPEQALFLNGKFPISLPNGFYKGSVKGIQTSWQGKKFDSSRSMGINIFKVDGKNGELYSFKTYKDQGLVDKNIDVLKIDYNISENPFWLRLIVDEIREIRPGEYLGKVHIKVLPGVPFSLGFFHLKK